MNRLLEMRSTWTSLILIVALVAALIDSPAHAHEVHDHRAIARHATQNADSGNARDLLQAFRETGDDSYLDRAWQKLKPALAQQRNADILIDAALVAQARHHFALAMDFTKEALLIDSTNAQAYLLLASIALVQGNAELARDACKRLHNVPVLVVITCQSRVAVAAGNIRNMREKLGRLLAIADENWLRPEWLAWSFSVAGDLAYADGKTEEAIEHYTRSLAIAESTQVRSALVDVLIERGDYVRAEREIEAGASALPLVIRRYIVAKRRHGDHALAAEVNATHNTFQLWIAEQDWLHAREMARFYIDVLEKPSLARRLAEINVSLQREREDLLLLTRSH